MYYFGLDLGQAQDPSALSIAQKVKTKEDVLEYHTRHVERFELGITYPAIIDKLQSRINAVNISGDYMTITDATGVGWPVVDLMRKQGIKTVPVIITAGEKELFDPVLGGWKVPKRVLVSNLQVLLQNGQLKFADGMMHAKELINELINFKIKITAHGNDTYEAWREGDHDDLVLSLALAVWYAVRFGTTEERRSQILIPNPWLAIKEL